MYCIRGDASFSTIRICTCGSLRPLSRAPARATFRFASGLRFAPAIFALPRFVIVPGGALRADGKKWLPARAGNWLLPRAAVTAAFRRGFHDALQAAAPDLHAQIGDAVWRDGWWVHIEPAGSGTNVVRYLARYVSRTAISDDRIIAADDHAVRFRYTDSATKERKECTLTADALFVWPPQGHPPVSPSASLRATRGA